MPPPNDSPNLSKYFTWEFIKLLILACTILGGFFEMRSEVNSIRTEFKHISESVNSMKATMDKKFDKYDDDIKEFYKNEK